MYNVLEYLEKSAYQFPHKIAFEDKDKRITYKELMEKSKQIGSSLALKIEIGSPVPIFMDKSVDTICLIFGILYAGGFYVMLDTKQPPARIKHILSTLNTDIILTSNDYLTKLNGVEFQGNMFLLGDLYGKKDDDMLLDISSQMIDTMPVYGIFTSGSTGIPKGVVVSHRNVIDFIDIFTETFHIDENDVIGNQAPWDFDVSIKDIFSTIKSGATMQIIPKQYFSMPSKLLDFLCEREVSTLIWAVSAICIVSTLNGFEYRVPDKIKKVMFSGEVMPIKQLNIWKHYLPNAMYVNLYGPTEITCNCTYHIIEENYELGQTIPIGRPFKNEKVFLLDENNKEIKEKNIKGEICVSGTAVSLGYYNNKEQTLKSFCQNPLNNYYREIIYRTGDLGYYDAKGRLCFSSRRDFQIKHMGHRIELSEIESTMDKNVEIKRSCCIFVDNKIIAYYIGNIEKRELIRFLKKELPIFMVPNVFYRINAFPITKNGKIDRKVLEANVKEKVNV